MAATHLPDGFHTVTPYLLVQGADRLIDFLTQAFDAAELESQEEPPNRIKPRTSCRPCPGGGGGT